MGGRKSVIPIEKIIHMNKKSNELEKATGYLAQALVMFKAIHRLKPVQREVKEKELVEVALHGKIRHGFLTRTAAGMGVTKEAVRQRAVHGAQRIRWWLRGLNK